jgi:heat shock protein HslJ
MRSGVLLLALALVAEPFGARAATAPDDAVAPLDGTSWTLSTLGERKPNGHERVRLEFKGDRLLGTDGCNRYGGPYSTSGARLRIGPDVISTQMACPTEVMELAGAYMAMLLGVQGYRIDNGTLELLDASGMVTATFAAQAAPGTGAHP